MSRKILVTGAAGFIGTTLVKELIKTTNEKSLGLIISMITMMYL